MHGGRVSFSSEKRWRKGGGKKERVVTRPIVSPILPLHRVPPSPRTVNLSSLGVPAPRNFRAVEREGKTGNWFLGRYIYIYISTSSECCQRAGKFWRFKFKLESPRDTVCHDYHLNYRSFKTALRRRLRPLLRWRKIPIHGGNNRRRFSQKQSSPVLFQ